MSRLSSYQPPFPWFGGKSPVASRVWMALGDVANYVEPFCGSCAVLMLRRRLACELLARVAA
jgi:site-specific DNA-adenine methylase